MSLFSNYPLRIIMLSPVHVGAGKEKDWVRNIDYIKEGDFVYILDKERLYLDMDDELRRTYLGLLHKAQTDKLRDFTLDNFDIENYCLHKFTYKRDLNVSEIKPLIRNGNGETYIPGSSLKGALHSVLFHSLYQNKKEVLKRETVFDRRANSQRPLRLDEYDEALIGSFDKSIMRYIRPGDAVLTDTEIAGIKLFNLYQRGDRWSGGYKRDNFSLALETFAYETEGYLRLSIADGFAEEVGKLDKKLLPKYYSDVFVAGQDPLETLFGLANAYTRVHLERELAFFKSYEKSTDDIEIAIEQLEKLLNEELPSDANSCLLRMASGSGYHGITGDWRFTDHNSTLDRPDPENKIYNFRTKQKEPARYKSRKVTEQYVETLGFVMLVKE